LILSFWFPDTFTRIAAFPLDVVERLNHFMIVSKQQPVGLEGLYLYLNNHLAGSVPASEDRLSNFSPICAVIFTPTRQRYEI
jgi:hypothetical protein